MIDPSHISLAQMLVVAAIATIVGELLILRARANRRPALGTTGLQLRFPRDLDATRVEALMASVSGWRPPRWRRWSTPSIVFEVHATATGIQHFVILPDNWRVAFERLLAAHLPGVRVEHADVPAIDVGFATTYRLSSGSRPLRAEPGQQARTLIGALQPLREHETVVLQLIVAPPPPSPVPFVQKATSMFGKPAAARTTSEEVSALRQKLSSPQLLATLRIGSGSPHQDRQTHLVRRVEAGLHHSNAPGAHLERRLLTRRVTRQLQERTAPVVEWPLVLGTAEILGILAWPVEVEHIAGLDLAGCRPLAPSQALKHEGMVIGDAVEHGEPRPVAIDLDARHRHLTVVGPTGTGKTTLMAQLAIHDMTKPECGLLVLDPKGDLADVVLQHVPGRDCERVVVIDAGDADRPVGINPLRMPGVSPDLAAEQLASLFHRVWASSWGPRTDDLMRASLRTIVTDPDGSLADLGPLLTDPSFRHRLTAELTDPVLVSFWKSFEAFSDGERQQVIAPSLSRWRAIMGRPALRRAFGQPHPELDLATTLDAGGIVVVRLSAGVLGEDAVALYGAIVMTLVWNLIQGRASQPASKRRDLMVFADEFSRYVALPVPLEEMLSQARSFRVGIVLAAQHLAQMPTDMRATVMRNTRSKITFQLGHDDAVTMAKEFGQNLTPEDLKQLDPFEIVGQLFAASRTQPACTMRTRPLPEPISDPQEIVEQSRQRWGRDGREVDEWLLERLSPRDQTSDRQPPGRRPRRPR